MIAVATNLALTSLASPAKSTFNLVTFTDLLLYSTMA